MKFSAVLVLAVVCFAWRASATSYTCPLNPTIFTFTFASLNCTIVSDGPIEIASLTNVFTVPEAAVARSYRKNFRDINPVLFSQNALIVELPTGRALFDTGSFNLPEIVPQFPFYENAGQLMSNLRAAGIPPTTIRYVFLTHGHVDHVSGLVTSDGKRAFPHADVFVGLREHLFWSNSTPSAPDSPTNPESLAEFARVYQGAVGPYDRIGRLHLVDSENEEEASPMEGITYISSFGHTPGHCAIEIKQDDERMVLIGDAWVSTADQLQNPEWGFITETNLTEAYLSRETLLPELSKTESLVLAYHESFPGLGYVQERGPFFEWVPIGPQKLGFGVQRVC